LKTVFLFVPVAAGLAVDALATGGIAQSAARAGATVGHADKRHP
jgi:hypothetical protein